MEEILYRGYSSFAYERDGSFVLTNVEIVKADILNHIYTRRGERVYLPNFGTIIPDMAFEPLDDITIDIVKEELLRVIEYDPRVELIKMSVTPLFDANTLIADVTLLYIELNLTDNLNLRIEFENTNV